ncbi:MAG TPA: ABC transporter ATP-binding protein [Casimicrobiaceae bacterium]
MNVVDVAPGSAPGAPASLRWLYRNVWHHAKGVRIRYLVALAMLVGSQVLKLAVPWLAAQAIDTVQVAGTEQLARAAALAGGIFLVYLSSWALHGPGRVIERNVGLHVRRSVADALYARLASLPLAWHDKHHSGEVQQRAQQASQALASFTENQFIYLQNLVNVLGPLIALWLVSTLTGTIAMAGFLAIAYVIMRYDRALMRLAQRTNHLERGYQVRVLDFLGNISTVLSLRLQDVSRRIVAARLADVFEPARRAIRVNEQKWCAVDLLTIGLAWALVAVYAWQAHLATQKGAPLLLGGVFMVYQYAQQAGGVIGSMAANLQNFSRYKVDFASADPIFHADDRVPSSTPVKPDWRTISARGLTFTYTRSDGARGGVREVAITLHRGDRIALIGPSGGGKSTLLRLLAGLYEPEHGYYQVDGRTGFGLRHLGSVATLIPQEAEVFEASLRDNVTFGAEHPPGALERAAYLGAFDAVAAALPGSWATPISERGLNLSGGQRQRLALARGLLAASASSILLLDEPTSALDQATEARVFERLRDALPDTCILASIHRLSALAHFDHVVLMADGHVVDAGPVAEVLERQPQLGAQVVLADDAALRSVAS